MRAVLQRVKSASVTIDGKVKGAIDQGYLILLGVGEGDGEAEADWLWDKIRRLRIFADAQGKTNLSLEAVQGEVLVVSQFTLWADLQRGNRPGFSRAGKPDEACTLYEYFVSLVKKDLGEVQTGEFGADMEVALVNDGPFTLWLDTEELMKKSGTSA